MILYSDARMSRMIDVATFDWLPQQIVFDRFLLHDMDAFSLLQRTILGLQMRYSA